MGKKDLKEDIIENKMISIYAKENISIWEIFIKAGTTKEVSPELIKEIRASRLAKLVEIK